MATDSFWLGDEELIACQGTTEPGCAAGGTHTTKHQSSSRIVYDTPSNTFTITSAAGTITTLEPLASRSSGPTYRWGIKTVRDLHNNVVTYNWWCDTATPRDYECYPDSVVYNNASVKLHYQNRPDPIVYATGRSLIEGRYRLKTVDVTVSSARVRAYGLNYSTTQLTNRSLLSDVTQFGTDAVVTAGVASGVGLPPTVFTYAPEGDGRFSQSAYTPRGDTSFGNDVSVNKTYWWRKYFDFNGDGYEDYCRIHLNAGSACFRSLGNGTFAAPVFGSPTPSLGSTNSSGVIFTNWPFFSLDFDSDGKIDYCRFNKLTLASYCFRSLGDGTFASPVYTNPDRDLDATWAQHLIDFDGDSKLDYCRIHSANAIICRKSLGDGSFGPPVRTDYANEPASDFIYPMDFDGDGNQDYCRLGANGGAACFRSLGNGSFGPRIYTASPAIDWDPFAMDANGDGKMDYCRIRNWASDTNCYLSLGDGTFSDAISSTTGVEIFDGGTRLLDANGDAQSDYTRYIGNVPTTPTFSLHLFASKGDGTYTAPIRTDHPSPQLGHGLFGVGDFNGDGRSDRIFVASDGGSYVYYEPRSSPALGPALIQVTNAGGGRTSIAYTSSATWGSTQTSVGFVFPVVSSIALNDGRTGAADAVTRYEYQGARWSPTTKRLLGFEKVITIDPASTTSTTTFKQSEMFAAGRPTNSEVRDSGGKLLSRVSYEYVETQTQGVWASNMVHAVHSTCDGALCVSSDRTFEYDAFGTPVKEVENSAGAERTTVTEFAFNPTKFLRSSKRVTIYAGLNTSGPVLRDTRMSFDGQAYGASPVYGHTTRTEQWLAEEQRWVVLTNSNFDTYGNTIETSNATANRVTTTYDSTYHLYPLSSTRHFGTTTQTKTYAWNAALGVLSAVTDENSQTTSYTYDRFGRATTVALPLGGQRVVTFENEGNPNTQAVRTETFDGSVLLASVRNFSDGLGRVYKTQSSSQSTTLTEYDGRGLVARVSMAYNPATETPRYTTHSYDGLGRAIRTVRPDGATHTTTYGVKQVASDPDYALPRLTKTDCDENNQCIRYVADERGNHVMTAELVGTSEYRTRAVYDRMDQTIQLTDSLGNVSTRTFDSLGRKVINVDPDAGTWRYAFDDNGRMVTQTDARGTAISFSYDAQSRLTEKRTGTTVLASYFYDETGANRVGRLTRMTDSSGSTTWQYDALGRVTSEAKLIGADSYTVGQAWDAANRMRSLTYPDGEVVAFSYGADGCATTVGNYVTGTTCNALGHVTSQTFANGTVLSFSYDANRGWLAGVTLAKGATTRDTVSYGRDPAGRILSKTGLTPNDSWTFGYDALNRLQVATNVGTAAWNQTYTYDQLGRLTSKTGVGTYAYPAVGQPRPHAPCSVGGTSCATGSAFQYDANGNRTTGDGSTYAYDALNRLSAVNGTTYKYDGLDRRVAAGLVNFVMLGDKILMEQDRSTTTRTKYYYYGDRRIARKIGTAVTYYFGDLVGTTSRFFDSAGSVVGHRVRSPFGTNMTVADSGSISDSFGLAGMRITDSWLHTGARYMDPLRAQFTSPDVSAVANIANPQGLNRYAYADNNPVAVADPSGYQGIEPITYQGDIAIGFGHEHGAGPNVSGIFRPGDTSGINYHRGDLRAPTAVERTISALGAWWNKPRVDKFVDLLSSVNPWEGAAGRMLGMAGKTARNKLAKQVGAPQGDAKKIEFYWTHTTDEANLPTIKQYGLLPGSMLDQGTAETSVLFQRISLLRDGGYGSGYDVAHLRSTVNIMIPESVLRRAGFEFTEGLGLGRSLAPEIIVEHNQFMFRNVEASTGLKINRQAAGDSFMSDRAHEFGHNYGLQSRGGHSSVDAPYRPDVDW